MENYEGLALLSQQLHRVIILAQAHWLFGHHALRLVDGSLEELTLILS